MRRFVFKSLFEAAVFQGCTLRKLDLFQVDLALTHISDRKEFNKNCHVQLTPVPFQE